jgi:CelD/BcsL family acetyltransferase involved in cellulose biosynthesis
MLDVEVITEEERFEALAPIWDPLLDKSRARTLFLTYEWMRTWWRFYGDGRELCLLLFTDGDEPVGIAPLCREVKSYREVETEITGSTRMLLPGGTRKSGPFSVTEIGFLGTGPVCSDFLDVFCLPGYEERVADRFVDFATATLSDWDLMTLTEVPDHSPVLRRLEERCRAMGGCRKIHRFASLSAPLPGDYDAYLDTLSRKSRYNARKKLRDIQQRHADVRYVLHADPATLGEAMDAFIGLHQQRWNDDGMPGVFTTPQFIGFHKAMAEVGLDRGWLRLGFLVLDGVRAFALYGYRYGEKLYLYQQGSSVEFPRLNLGYAALALSFRAAVEEGATSYDFLRGSMAYKTHWAKARRDLYQIQFYRPGPRTALFRLHAGINTSTWLRRRVKKFLPTRTGR